MKTKQELSVAGDGYHMAASYAINLHLGTARELPRARDPDLSLRLCITPNKDKP